MQFESPLQFGAAAGTPFLRDVHRSKFEEGDWTDDCDQLILVLRSLVQTNGIADPKDFAAKLQVRPCCGAGSYCLAESSAHRPTPNQTSEMLTHLTMVAALEQARVP